MRTPTAVFAVAVLFAAAPFAPQAQPAPRSGPEVVQYQCVLCHGPGLSGAPRIGDTKAWNERARAGLDNLVRSASRGRGAMPPAGGLADLTEPELRAAIAEMLRRSGVESGGGGGAGTLFRYDPIASNAIAAALVPASATP
jgi:cytochrome c5